MPASQQAQFWAYILTEVTFFELLETKSQFSHNYKMEFWCLPE